MPFTLRQLRHLKELSQKEVAERLGVSELTLANYEKGFSQPNATTIQKMLDLYEVKFDDVIFFSK